MPEPVRRLTRIQGECLRDIEHSGSARGYAWSTIVSLREWAFIELVGPDKPHPKGARTGWRLTEKGQARFNAMRRRPYGGPQ